MIYQTCAIMKEMHSPIALRLFQTGKYNIGFVDFILMALQIADDRYCSLRRKTQHSLCQLKQVWRDKLNLRKALF